MATSLARQLKKLQAPQTSLLNLDKKKPSLLFDPSEAASLDRSAVYDIGISGLVELIKLDKRFAEFLSTLYALSSKNFERAVQTAEVNSKIDEQVEQFLILVSPYFTLKSAQKALEWLVNRYHVHQFNTSAWIMAILPFHETKIFVRAIQLLDLRSETGQWHWLYKLQGYGVPLPKNTLLNHCVADIGLLQLICSTLEKAIEVHGGKQSVLNTFVAFYCTTVIGMVENTNQITEEQLASLLPSLNRGLTSKMPDLISGCYMVVAQLTRKCKLSFKVAEILASAIIEKMLPSLTLEAVTLLVLLCSNQTFGSASPVQKCARKLITNPNLVPVLATLATGYQVSPLVSPLIESLVLYFLDGNDEEISLLLQKLVEEVRFLGEDTTAVIKSFINGYLNSSNQTKPQSKDQTLLMVKSVLNRLETQYPMEYERTMHISMGENSTNNARKDELEQLFGTNWDVDHTTLFLKLNHNTAETRASAVKAIVKAIKDGKLRNPSFAVSTVEERLLDSSPLVVAEILRLEKTILRLIPIEKQFPLLLAALSNGPTGEVQEWLDVRINLIKLLCSPTYVKSLTDDQHAELFLALLPYIMPLTEAGIQLVRAFIHSAFVARSPMLNALAERLPSSNDVDLFCNTVHVDIDRAAPLANDNLNLKLFELIAVRLLDPSCPATFQLPAILVITPLIKSLSNPALAARMAMRFVHILRQLVPATKRSSIPDANEKVPIRSLLEQAYNRGVLTLETLVYSAMELYECITINYTEMSTCQWAALSKPQETNDARLLFLLSVFRFLIAGLTSRSAPLFQSAMQTLFQRIGRLEGKIFFLSLVWSDLSAPDALRAVALKMASSHLEKPTANVLSWATDHKSFIIPQLICSLGSQSGLVRQQALATFKALGTSTMSSPMKAKGFSDLVAEINQSSEELKLDAEQLKYVLERHLTKRTASATSLALFEVTKNPNVPDCVKADLLKALERVNSVDDLTRLLPLMNQLIKQGAASTAPLNLLQSNILTMLLERFSAATAGVLTKDAGLKSFQLALQSSKCFIAAGDGVMLSPQDILIEVITKDFFRALTSMQVKSSIFGELLDIIIGTEKTVTVRQTRKALKRISGDAALVAKQLEFKSQPVSTDGKMKVREARNNQRAAQPKPGQCPQWNRILAVLEMLPTKKQIANVHQMIAPLFELLKNCLDEEEQAPLEYSKQLILSSLLTCCQKLPPGDGTKLACEFNTGLIVQCVRVSNNPQTHHQALLLLSLAAQLFPSHVLHNIMAIFTFMGTSVLRQDDAYSFQVIAKTLESVIPTLIEASMKTAVEPVVTTVIHVFADALPEVPEHRRIPVFDKLLSTLDPEIYLWLAPTLILSNMATQGPRLGRAPLKGDESDVKDRIVPDIEFSLNVCHLYAPRVQLNACIRMVEYLHTLPAEKTERRRLTSSASKDMSEGSVPFCTELNTGRQLCHFKLLVANFISTLLSSNRLIEQLVEMDDAEKPTLEKLYRRLIEVSLEYTQSISRLVDQQPAKTSTLLTSSEQAPNPKFWRSLLHRCYDIIDRVNSLLPRSMFIAVVQSLLLHPIPSIRRRAMELLSAKLQHQSNFFVLSGGDETALLQLIPLLTAIARGQQQDGGSTEEAALNQQTAFFTLKLLCRLLGPSFCQTFKPVLEVVVDAISPATCSSSNVLASAFLCLAELVQTMAVHSLPYLPRFGANLVARLEDLHSIENHDLLLLSVVTAVMKLVETLPQFLVPYLPTILKQICYLSAKQPVSEKPSQLQTRLKAIRHSLAISSVPRSLISSITQVYADVTLIESGSFRHSPSIGPLMSILSESFGSMSRDDLTAQLPSLTTFFIKSLDARWLLSLEAGRNASKQQVVTMEVMKSAEEPVVDALVSLMLKLTEASFRPLFFQLYEWATRLSDVRKERLVSFYNVTMHIADKLKGLFVSFAGHFIRNAAQVIVDTNVTQRNGSLPFDGPYAESNTLMLLEFVLRCLYRVCLHDNENFINKERFETLMEPLVDQLENQLGSPEVVSRRVNELLVPLLAQLAVAASDDYLWKALHYQLLLKTRSESYHVRLGSLRALAALVEKLGEDYLAFLPEAIPFLAELLEDDVEEVELAAQTTIAHMENILGEPLQKYF